MNAHKERMERPRTSTEKKIDAFAQTLIVLSMVAFAIETLPDLSANIRMVLDLFEYFCVAIFTTEYLLRVIYSEKRWKFVTSFFGIIDLLAILPFYLTLGFDARSLRAFRLLRLFRVLKLARYSAAIQRYHHALMISKEEIVLFLAASSIVLFISAAGIYHFEHEAQPEVFRSIFHSLWWAVVTLTSVGYGDIYPITAGGRLFTFGVLMIGLGVFSMPAGLIAAALTKARQDFAESQAILASMNSFDRIPVGMRTAPKSSSNSTILEGEIDAEELILAFSDHATVSSVSEED